jgi:hypothetical protein
MAISDEFYDWRFVLRTSNGARLDLIVSDRHTSRFVHLPAAIYLFVAADRSLLLARTYMLPDPPLSEHTTGPLSGVMSTHFDPRSPEATEAARSLEASPSSAIWLGPMRFRWTRTSRTLAELLVACPREIRRVMVTHGDRWP